MSERPRNDRDGECICDYNPSTTEGPLEDCPFHGRPYAYWIERGDVLAERLAEAERDRDKYLAAFSEQFDQREEYAVECKRLWKQETRFEELADGYGHAGRVDIANAITEALRGDA